MKQWVLICTMVIAISCNINGQERIASIKTFKKDNDTVSAYKPQAFNVHTPLQYDFYNYLAPFCKAEYKFQKATHIPLKVRVGTIEQCDYLEQKPNAIKQD